jgi:glutaconate CoA-transferase subunit B
MRVISLHPGYTFEKVQENCGFQLLKANSPATTQPPTPEELQILRDEIDPNRYVIGR